MHHLDSLAFNIGNAAAQECVKCFDVVASGLPRKRFLAENHSCGETGAEADHESAGCHPLDGGDGRCRRHDVAKIRYKNCRANVEVVCGVEDIGDVDPDVFVQGR